MSARHLVGIAVCPYHSRDPRQSLDALRWRNVRQETANTPGPHLDSHMKKLSMTVALAAVACGVSQAQQFQQAVGAMPGPVVWSEAVKPIDADGDGWLDVIISNLSAAPTLLMNH